MRRIPAAAGKATVQPVDAAVGSAGASDLF